MLETIIIILGFYITFDIFRKFSDFFADLFCGTGANIFAAGILAILIDPMFGTIETGYKMLFSGIIFKVIGYIIKKLDQRR